MAYYRIYFKEIDEFEDKNAIDGYLKNLHVTAEEMLDIMKTFYNQRDKNANTIYFVSF